MWSYIKQSFYNPQQYQAVRNQPAKKVLWQFTKFGLVWSLIMTALLALILIPLFSALVKQARPTAEALYPANLVVTVKNGIVSTNQAEPYKIALDPALRQDLGWPAAFENLIVINTRATFAPERIGDMKTLIWLGRDFIAYHDGENKVTTADIHPTANILVNKSAVMTQVDRLAKVSGWFPVFLIPSLFIAFVFIFIFHLIVLLPLALIIWLLVRLKDGKARYSEAFKMSVRALVATLVISPVLIFMPGNMSALTFLLTIIIVMVNVYKLPSGEVGS